MWKLGFCLRIHFGDFKCNTITDNVPWSIWVKAISMSASFVVGDTMTTAKGAAGQLIHNGLWGAEVGSKVKWIQGERSSKQIDHIAKTRFGDWGTNRGTHCLWRASSVKKPKEPLLHVLAKPGSREIRAENFCLTFKFGSWTNGSTAKPFALFKSIKKVTSNHVTSRFREILGWKLLPRAFPNVTVAQRPIWTIFSLSDITQ